MNFAILKSAAQKPKKLLSVLPKMMKVNYAAESTQQTKKAATQKCETKQSEPVFLQRESKFKAGYFEDQISFDFQSTTRTNWKIFQHDYGQWLVDYMETFLKPKKLKGAHLTAEELMNEIGNVRSARKNVENKLEEVIYKLSQCPLKIRFGSTSRIRQELEAEVNELKDLALKLKAERKNLNLKEEHYFNLLLHITKDSGKKKDTPAPVTTSTVAYTHKSNLIKDLKHAVNKISGPNQASIAKN